MQSAAGAPCGGQQNDCLRFHGRVVVDAQGRVVCDVERGGFKIAVRGVVGRAADVASVNAAIAPGTQKQIWSLFIQTTMSTTQQEDDAEVHSMRKLDAIDPCGSHHAVLVHRAVPQVGLCAELAKIHANLVARGVKGNFLDFTAKYGLGVGVHAEDIPLLRWSVMYVTHAGLEIFNFRHRAIYDEKQNKEVRISWRVMLRGIAEFLRFANKLFENNVYHLDVSGDNLRYKLDHAILPNGKTAVTHVHFLLIDYGLPGPSGQEDDLLWKIPIGFMVKNPPYYELFELGFMFYCTLLKNGERTLEDICDELCRHSFQQKIPEAWAPEHQWRVEMNGSFQYLAKEFRDTHTTHGLTKMWVFVVKTLRDGIQKYPGDIKQEIADWPSHYISYVSRLAPLSYPDAPVAHMPACVALFNFFRAVCYTNTESFEVTEATLNIYKQQYDLYGYVEMMSWVLRNHSHSSHRVMQTAANRIKRLVAHKSTDTLLDVAAKIEAISLL